MATTPGILPSLTDGVATRSDQSAVVLATTNSADYVSSVTSSAPPTSWMDMGVRGQTWQECSVWFPAMPGAIFQQFAVFLFLAFMGSGRHKVAAIFHHVLCAIAFLSFAVWGAIDACSPDVFVWGLLLFILNVLQVVYIHVMSSKMEKVFTDEMQEIYHLRFAPFEISPEVFTELVTCKGCQVLKICKGHNYAAEAKTPIERLSLLVSGKARVTSGNKVLHYVNKNEFLDSPEWEAMKSSNNSKAVYQVSITAESECTYITWKRKSLQALIAKRKRLGKLFNNMIGRDIVNKLYLLNTNQFNQRGYRYDIRLPIIMSLRDDVMEREKRKKHIATGLESPQGRRHKRLGKKAEEHYRKMFARRMSAKLEMMKSMKDRKSSVDSKKKPSLKKDK